MGYLTNILKEWGISSDLGWHREEHMREALLRLENMSPDSLGFAALKGEVLKCFALNSMDQFSRGKHQQGLESMHLYDDILRAVEKRQRDSDLVEYM